MKTSDLILVGTTVATLVLAWSAAQWRLDQPRIISLVPDSAAVEFDPSVEDAAAPVAFQDSVSTPIRETAGAEKKRGFFGNVFAKMMPRTPPALPQTEKREMSGLDDDMFTRSARQNAEARYRNRAAPSGVDPYAAADEAARAATNKYLNGQSGNFNALGGWAPLPR